MGVVANVRDDASKRLTQRHKIGRRQKLLAAHYAGAIPQDLLAAEMNRLTRGLADAEAEIADAHVVLGDVHTTLNQALAAAGRCEAQYEQAPPHIRRLINQGFFKKLYIGLDGSVERYELTEPFATLLGQDLAQPTHAIQASHAMADATNNDHHMVNDTGQPPEPVQDTLHAVEAQGQAWPAGVLEQTFSLVGDSEEQRGGLFGFGLKKNDLVGLLTSYSNRSDLLHELEVAAERLQQAQADDTPSTRSVRSPDRKGRVWGLTERLSEAQVQAIVAGFGGGMLRCQLAEQYKISVSSVARLLRKHRNATNGHRGSA